MKLAAILVLAAVSALSQTSSSHSGWNFADTLQAVTDAFVGNLISGAAVDNGSEVSVQATLDVTRVLSGSTTPGAEIAVAWRYQPSVIEGPDVTTKVPKVTGLWFLRRDAAGKPELLRASPMPTGLGGYYLPAGDSPRYYAAKAPLQYKIACEIGPMLESSAQPRIQFHALMMTLEALDRSATAEIFTYFSALPDPKLKAAGLMGRLTAGDASAVPEVEANLPTIAPVLQSGTLPPSPIMALNLKGDLKAAHSLGRLATGEMPWFEGNAPFLLANTRSPEVLPYLVVMIGSPNASTRGFALMAFCNLLGPMSDSKASPLWRPEMQQYCPHGSPVNDRPLEQKDTAYWKQWWEATRGEIAKTVSLPQVFPPARYSTAPPTRTVEVPVEIRFGSLVSIARQTGGPDFVGSQLGAEDRAIWDQVTTTIMRKLDVVQATSQEMLNRARITGTRPDLDESHALDQENRAAVKAGLDELRSRLSPAGWQTIERFMPNASGAVMTAPLK
jgi:hypothetical protein